MNDHFVYRAFDADDVLLYVRRTRHLPSGWTNRADEPYVELWGPHVDRFAVSGPYTSAEAAEVEAQAILTERPVFNLEEPSNVVDAARRSRALKAALPGVSLQAAARESLQESRARYAAEAVTRRRVLAEHPSRGDRYLAERSGVDA